MMGDGMDPSVAAAEEELSSQLTRLILIAPKNAFQNPET